MLQSGVPTLAFGQLVDPGERTVKVHLCPALGKLANEVELILSSRQNQDILRRRLRRAFGHGPKHRLNGVALDRGIRHRLEPFQCGFGITIGPPARQLADGLIARGPTWQGHGIVRCRLWIYLRPAGQRAANRPALATTVAERLSHGHGCLRVALSILVEDILKCPS